MTVGCRGGPAPKIGRRKVTCFQLLEPHHVVKLLIPVNYNQISAPDWMATQNFEITARIPRGTTKEQYAAM